MKITLAVLGLFSLVLGIIGIFLPLLPTTPFLLISAFLFAHSSPRLYDWLLSHKMFGEYIRSYRDEKSMSMRVKITAVLMLWSTMLYSIFFVVNDKWWLQLILASIATGVSVHIFLLKTKRVTK